LEDRFRLRDPLLVAEGIVVEDGVRLRDLRVRLAEQVAGRSARCERERRRDACEKRDRPERRTQNRASGRHAAKLTAFLLSHMGRPAHLRWRKGPFARGCARGMWLRRSAGEAGLDPLLGAALRKW